MHTNSLPKKMNSFAPDQICVGVLHAPLDRVREGVRFQLERTIKDGSICTELTRVNWNDFFDSDGILYDISRFQIAIFSIQENITIYICNLSDGWVSLYGNLVVECEMDAFFFRATNLAKAKYKVFEMIGWRQGALERHVRALQDDIGWTFLNNGTPFSFELSDRYNKYRISARIDLSLIKTYSARAGYDLSEITDFNGVCCRFWREYKDRSGPSGDIRRHYT